MILKNLFTGHQWRDNFLFTFPFSPSLEIESSNCCWGHGCQLTPTFLPISLEARCGHVLVLQSVEHQLKDGGNFLKENVYKLHFPWLLSLWVECGLSGGSQEPI